MKEVHFPLPFFQTNSKGAAMLVYCSKIKEKPSGSLKVFTSMGIYDSSDKMGRKKISYLILRKLQKGKGKK